MKHQKKGFTLIELLVVIAIIGILSTIGLVSLQGAREKARDAQRKTGVAQIVNALVLIYDDTNAYPNVEVDPADAARRPSYAISVAAACPANGNIICTRMKPYLPRLPAIAQQGPTLARSYYYTASSTVPAAGTPTDSSSGYAVWTRLEGAAASRIFFRNHLGQAGTSIQASTTLTDYECRAAATVNLCNLAPTGT